MFLIFNFLHDRYCGHGNGRDFLTGEDVQRLTCQAATLLIGCSSGKLHVNGALEAYGMTLNYIVSGWWVQKRFIVWDLLWKFYHFLHHIAFFHFLLLMIGRGKEELIGVWMPLPSHPWCHHWLYFNCIFAYITQLACPSITKWGTLR